MPGLRSARIGACFRDPWPTKTPSLSAARAFCDGVGSDWTWQLRVPASQRSPDQVIHEVLALAAGYGLGLQRPNGRINLFDSEGDLRTVGGQDEAVVAMATTGVCSQLWTANGVDVFLAATSIDPGTKST
jgi:hypothetical protein